jgi:hypothetical protein
LTVIDAKKLPALEILGKASVRVEIPGWSGGWEVLWPKPGVMVLAGGGMGGWWWPWLDMRGGGGIAGDFWFRPGFWGVGGGQLLAFDVSSSSTPALLSELNLTTNGWYSFSPTFGVGSLVYLSHSSSEPADDPTEMWIQRTSLDVIDYSDPATPTVRKPVSIPGMLEGVSHNGELLYTSGVHWTTNQTDWRVWLDASAYDGVSASLVDSLSLSQSWPVLVDGNTIFIGRQPENDQSKPLLGVWTLSDSGKFVSLATPPLVLSSPAQNFATFGDLLAVQLNEGIQLFDKSRPSSLISLGQDPFQRCLGYTLENADGAVDRGLWLPLGDYGVVKIGLNPPR